MVTEALKAIIRENLPRIESLPDGSFEKEHKLEGIRLLKQACEKSKNLYNDKNEINWLITRGLTLIYYDQRQHNQV